MVKVRLMKLGKRNDHFFRVVAISKNRKNTGEALENLGYWYPAKDEKKINKERVAFWASKGAQISPTVLKLIA